MGKTLIHDRVEQANLGKNPKAICRLKSGWVVWGDDQRIPGYCLLLSDPVSETINSLNTEQRKQFLFDMSIVGDVLQKVFGARLINYSILGNSDLALHAHIHPRHE